MLLLQYGVQVEDRMGSSPEPVSIGSLSPEPEESMMINNACY